MNKRLTFSLSIVIALLPILSPYNILGVSMADAIVAVSLLFCFVLGRKHIQFKGLATLHVVFALLTIFALAFTGGRSDPMVAIKVFVSFSVYLSFYLLAYKNIDFEIFFKVVLFVGTACAILAILQFVFSNMGINFYDGKLPFEEDKYSHVGSISLSERGVYRVHSFFEEPSYLAIYEIPLSLLCLIKKIYKQAILIILACLVCGSLLGVVGLVLSIVFWLIYGRRANNTLGYIVLFALLAITLFVGYKTSEIISTAFDYIAFRFTNFETSIDREGSSEAERLIGNLFLFGQYPPLNQLIGTGFNQYQFYFGLTKDYSNDFVSTLLNFGYIGLLSLFIFLYKTWKRVFKDGKVFIFFFILILAIDHVWFNTYFFYLLTFVSFYITTNKHEITRNNQ